MQPNKAIVGRNAFAHESGIHQDGVLKERTTFEIMDATEVGFESNSIVLGKHSGRHALKDALEQLGYKIEGGALNSAFKAFKEIADRKKQVTALDLEAIVSDEMRDRADAHELASFEVAAASEQGADGEGRRHPALGRGGRRRVDRRRPDRRRLPRDPGGDRESSASCVKYTVEAVTGGEDALGEVTVMLRTNGTLASGSGVATDIIEASARAYLRALSNSLEGAATREAEAATAEAAIERTGPYNHAHRLHLPLIPAGVNADAASTTPSADGRGPRIWPRSRGVSTGSWRGVRSKGWAVRGHDRSMDA